MDDRSVGLPERVERLVLDIAEELLAEDYRLGCAIGATTLETAATTPALRQETETAFASWSATLVAHFVQEGIATDQANALADSVVAGMEGATMLARARRDTAPLHHVAAALRAAVAAAPHPRALLQSRSTTRCKAVASGAMAGPASSRSRTSVNRFATSSWMSGPRTATSSSSSSRSLRPCPASTARDRAHLRSSARGEAAATWPRSYSSTMTCLTAAEAVVEDSHTVGIGAPP